jgi:hypothetical protein
MELIRKICKRADIGWWRTKYWWLDTPSGKHAQLTSAAMLLIVTVVGIVRESIHAFAPPVPGQPHQAIIWFVVWLIVALVVGLAIALTMNSKPAQPQDSQGKTPTTQDGRSATRYYGTCNITAPAQLAWKVVGKDPIMSDGGKK